MKTEPMLSGFFMCSNRFSKRRKIVFKASAILILALILHLAALSGSGLGARPLLLIPFAVSLCVWSNFSEAGCAVAGALCGFMLDYESGRLFGSSAFSLALFCAAVSALFSYLLKKNLPNAFGVNFVICLLYFSADYFFSFRIWPNESSPAVLLGETLPCAFWTISLSPAVFLAVKRILSPSDRLCEVNRSLYE